MEGDAISLDGISREAYEEKLRPLSKSL